MSDRNDKPGLLGSVDGAFLTRAYLYLEGELPQGALAILENDLSSSPRNAEAFVQLCLIRSRLMEELRRRGHGERDLVSLTLLSGDDPVAAADSMNDAMVAPAITVAEDGSADMELAGLMPEESGPPSAPDAIARRNWWSDWRLWSGIAAAILILIGTIAVFDGRANTPLASVSATASAQWDHAASELVGNKPLPPGTALKLTKGYAQLALANGSTVVLQGPCELRLDSPLQMTLASGRITASVSAAGHGLTVVTPHGIVVDLGTVFGVDASGNRTQVRVFVGRVEVRPVGTAHDQTVPLAAGDSAQLDDSGVDVQSGAVDTAGYVLDIHQITQPLTVHGTGAGLNKGDADPFWQVSSFPGNPAWQAAPAIVCTQRHDYAKSDSRSSWISWDKNLGDSPNGLYTFVTSIDATGIDPATIHLHLGAAADDGIVEIRLNGKPTGLHVRDSRPFQFLHQLTLDDGFTAGINRLEVVVNNARPSPMALRVELSGVGRRLVSDR